MDAEAADVAAAGSVDAELVGRCRRGDASAWRTLVERHQRLVHAIVRRVGLDEHAAADVFQTVFVRLIDHLPRLDDPRRLVGWIAVTARREALLQRRRARRTVSLDDGDAGPGDAGRGPAWEPADDAPLPDEALDELQQHARLREAFERLDARCRELLRRLFDDRASPDYTQIAAQLGMPVGSIGPTRGRCLAKLRRLFG